MPIGMWGCDITNKVIANKCSTLIMEGGDGCVKLF